MSKFFHAVMICSMAVLGSLSYLHADAADEQDSLCIKSHSEHPRPKLAGKYHSWIRDPYLHEKYQGTLEIKHLGDEVYQFTWDFGNLGGGTGTGIRDDHDKTHIAVTFINANSQTGVELYQVHRDGDLSGKWVYDGQTAIGYEHAERIHH